jgi:flagellar biosynthetic protein FlhB
MAKETPDGQQKSEAPSSKKLADARDRGQLAKSQDATTALIMLLGGIITFKLFVPLLQDQMEFMRTLFVNAPFVRLNEETIPEYFVQLALGIGRMLFPILLIIMGIGLFGEISQTRGIHFATKKFTEGLNFGAVFNPFSGLKRILFSTRSIVELIKGILKILIMGAVVWQVIASHTDKLLLLGTMPYQEIGGLIGGVLFELLWKSGTVFLVLAAGDYFYQRYQFKEDMRMTKQEVKEESKQMEGDMNTKARIRAMARQRLRKIMLSRVKTADVVIVNPTHYAVALKYDRLSMDAPMVVAKGVDHLALKMKEIAKENDVPIVENPPLARALYAAVDIDQPIPEELFKTVAQVLAYIYRLKQKA